MPENTENEFVVELSQLRAQAINDLGQPESLQQINDAFREGMSAGLDFAYRVVEDYRQSVRMNTRQAAVVDDIMSALVTEHDVRSEQPIRAIQVERVSAQAGDAMLAGLREALTAVPERVYTVPTPDPGPTTMNLEEVRPDLTQGCDGPCCRPESDPENVFDWVNTLPQHTSARAVTPTYVADDPGPEEAPRPDGVTCRCGLQSWGSGEAMWDGIVMHFVNGPCQIGIDPAEGES